MNFNHYPSQSMLNFGTVKTNEVEELSLNSNVRDSMAHLPGFVQPLLTWITGRAAKNQKRSTHTSYYHLF